MIIFFFLKKILIVYLFNELAKFNSQDVWMCSSSETWMLAKVMSTKVSKGAKIRSRYNQEPRLTQDINGKVTTSQLDITNESQEVSPFPTGDHKASTNRHAWKHNKQDRNNINDPQKKHSLGTVSKNILPEGLN